MKVVVAMDSFKGCLSSKEAGYSIKDAISSLCDSVEVIAVADGGEGSIEAMISNTNAAIREISTLDPLRRKINATYAKTDRLAIIEMASCSGLTLLKESEKNPALTDTFGLGLMIKDALRCKIRQFIICIGGSATNDAGMGMLEALGYRFYDKNNTILHGCGKNLIKVVKIDSSYVMEELKTCKFEIACDVDNPLYGKNGASYIYARQKGAHSSMIQELDAGLRNFSKAVFEFRGIDNSKLKGSGAGGGLAFAFVSFFHSKLKPGFKIIAQLANLQRKISTADLVITGEGSLDKQSTMGKTPIQVAKLAKKFKIPVIAFAGCICDEDKNLNSYIDAFFCIQQRCITSKEAMKTQRAKSFLQDTAYQAVKLFKIGFNRK